MIIPFNLAYKEIQGLHRKTRNSLRYFVEVINFPNKGSLTYVSKNQFKPASLNKGLSQKNCLPSKPKDQVRASLETLSKENKSLHKAAVQVIRRQYYSVGETTRKFAREIIQSSLRDTSYAATIEITKLVIDIAGKKLTKTDRSFVEQILNHLIKIKSPEIANKLSILLKRIIDQTNFVLYLSDYEDAHLTDYMQKMDRKFIFVFLDPKADLRASAQGYPIPFENLEVLFNLACFVWWRKPTPLAPGKSPLEKFVNREIDEICSQLYLKYQDKIFPQIMQDDHKFIYFSKIRSLLKHVRFPQTKFENSTFLWKKGDFIKPLRTQAVLFKNLRVEQNFSPFIFNGNASKVISSMPIIIRQPSIKKVFEIRGSFFENDVSCVKIDTPNLKGSRARVDWRYSTKVSENMHAVELDKRIAGDLISSFKKMRILFCTFDLVYDGKHYYLLDINHNGQWIFSDRLCKMRTTKKMLTFLGRKGSNKGQF